VKRAISPTSGALLGAVDFANLAEVALEHGPSLRAVALECHAAACERAFATVKGTGGTVQCARDPAVLGPIVCNYAIALADADDFARCARCIDRLVAALGANAAQAADADPDAGPAGGGLDPSIAQRLAVTLFNRAVGLAQTPSPQ
jgi:hypothetical protein